MTHFSLTRSKRTTNNFLTWWKIATAEGHSQSSAKAPRKHRAVGLSTTEGKPSVMMADRIPRFATAQPPHLNLPRFYCIRFCHDSAASAIRFCHDSAASDSATILPLTIKQLPQNCSALTCNWIVHDPYMPTREKAIQRIYFRNILIQDYYQIFILLVCKSTYSFFALLFLTLLSEQLNDWEVVVTRPYKNEFLFPFPARITFGERIKKNFSFYFIEFDVKGTTINCFSAKADPLVL